MSYESVVSANSQTIVLKPCYPKLKELKIHTTYSTQIFTGLVGFIISISGFKGLFIFDFNELFK